MNKLDDVDRRILDELQGNGRVSNRDLAEHIALSPSPCWRRVRELEGHGVIRSYVALLDPASVGLNVTAFAHVSLENHHPETVAQFDKGIQAWPEVLECHSTSGDYDYIAKIVARDMAAYENFLHNKLLMIPAVRTVNTRFALQQKKYTTRLPLNAAAEAG